MAYPRQMAVLTRAAADHVDKGRAVPKIEATTGPGDLEPVISGV
jgi:hypothetical protein